MKGLTKRYETVYIVNASLDDAQIDAIIEKTKEFIVKQGGEIQEVEKWGRKRLSFPIQKKNNGFYVVTYFSAPGDFVTKLTRYYHLEEQIIRHLTILLDKKALLALEQKAKEKEASGEAQGESSAESTSGA